MLSLLFVVAQAHPCQPCHNGIVETYAKTAMARTSGRVTAQHAPAGQASIAGASVQLQPGGAMTATKDGWQITRQLEWFLGSGRVGHSYLFAEGGRLFQSPISFYSQAGQWQLSPGFQRNARFDLTRAIEPGCLNCHTSSYNPATLALEPGISCAKCHGDATAHARAPNRVAALNPAKLPREESDSVCAVCHLTGAARVARWRADGQSWQPGRKLSDYSAVFTAADVNTGNMVGVTSHFEKLATARCRDQAGAALRCTSCHDPHSEPAAPAAFFNAECQQCHVTGRTCPQAPQGDCTSCHMPKGAGRGVDHSSYTDHSIRIPGKLTPLSAELRSFWPAAYTERDLALAEAILGRWDAALPRLEAAIAANPKDLTARSQLAQAYERAGVETKAAPHYEAILTIDPLHAVANANLGVIRIKAGRVAEAITLWRKSLAANPAQTGIRMNLAQALFRTGRRDEAAAEIEQVLRFDPDQPQARRLLQQLRP